MVERDCLMAKYDTWTNGMVTCVKISSIYYFPYKLAQNQPISHSYGRPKQEERKKRKNKNPKVKIQEKIGGFQVIKQSKVKFLDFDL